MKKITLIIFTFLFFSISAFSQVDTKNYLKNAEEFGRQQQYIEAVAEMDKAIKFEPNNADLYLFRALYFERLRNKSAVLNDLKVAFILAPRKEFIHTNGEMILRRTNQSEDLKQLLDYLISIDESNYVAYGTRARTRAYLKDFVGAYKDVLKILELRPDKYQEINALYSSLYFLKNDKNIFNYYNELFDLLEKQIERFNSNPPRINDVEFLNSQEIKSTLTKLNGNLIYFLLECASLYLEKGDVRATEAILKRVILIEPASNSYKSRALFYKKQGEFQKAIADLNKSLELLNKSTGNYLRSFVLVDRADLFILTKQYGEAIADYEEVLRSNTLFGSTKKNIEEKLASSQRLLTESENK